MTDSWLAFYRPYFQSDPDAASFVDRCEAQRPPYNAAKLIMHQTRRLIHLANNIPQIEPKRESLQLLFLIICAECVAKLHQGFSADGQSRRHVRLFFNTLLPAAYREKLCNGFVSTTYKPLRLRRIIDLLYDVRCDVVHEGRYWMFTLHDGSTDMLNVDPNFIARLSIEELRDIIIQGCIAAAADRL
jgi:hypothetical protein